MVNKKQSSAVVKLNHDQINEELIGHIKENYGTVYRASKEWDISQTYISDVLSKKKKPTPGILEKINGVRHKEEYYTIDNSEI